MALFQTPPRTEEEVEAAKPLDISPEEVLEYDEDRWYREVYRGDDAPQLTLRAVLVGSGLGFLLALSNLYIALKTGWHLGVAVTACILSYSLWGFLQNIRVAKTPMGILENNCMQSTASAAGYSTGGTITSAISAMLMLSVTAQNPKGQHMPWYLLMAWVAAVAAFGCVLAIPMKRNLINQERLRFPTGAAAAVTLQSLYSKGSEAAKKAKALLYGALLGVILPPFKDLEIVKNAWGDRSALIRSFSKIFDILPGITVGKKTYPPSAFTMKLDHSLVLLAAGAFIGIRITLSMVLGGLILAFVLAPYALTAEWTNQAGRLVYAASSPYRAWKEIGIWLGAPLLVSSGLVSFLGQWRTILRAFQGMLKGNKQGADTINGIAKADVEVPARWFWIGGAVSGTAVVLMAWQFFEIPPHYGVLALCLTFVLALVAARATGESDITPTGAMGKLMQLSYGVLIPQSVKANLMTAGITAGSASASADLLTDLKSGYLLGANPRRQFLAQAMGIFSGTIATVLGFYLFIPDATQLTGVHGMEPKFPAPAAQQWLAVAKVFQIGVENLHPLARTCIAIGLVVGAVLALLEMLLPKAKKFLPSATGIGLGLILPFYYPLSMFLGAVITWAYSKADKEGAERYAIPLASGVIAGESLIGVVIAGLNNFVLH